MSAFTNHFSFEFKTGLRNPTLMLMNYLFPLGFYAMMGLVMVQINPGFKDTLIPSIVIVSIMVSTLLGLPGPLVEFARGRHLPQLQDQRRSGVLDPDHPLLEYDLPRADRLCDHCSHSRASL